MSAFFGYLKGVQNELALKHIPHVKPRNDTLAGPVGRMGDMVSCTLFQQGSCIKQLQPANMIVTTPSIIVSHCRRAYCALSACHEIKAVCVHMSSHGGAMGVGWGLLHHDEGGYEEGGAALAQLFQESPP